MSITELRVVEPELSTSRAIEMTKTYILAAEMILNHVNGSYETDDGADNGYATQYLTALARRMEATEVDPVWMLVLLADRLAEKCAEGDVDDLDTSINLTREVERWKKYLTTLTGRKL